jgi:hypothetical protein
MVEQRWHGLIEEKLSIDKRFKVLTSKTVTDLVICRDGNPPVAFFLEFKIHIPSDLGKRMGLGDRQAEIIEKRPAYFERYLRWVLCRATKEDLKYVFTTTAVIADHVPSRGKQKNISPKIFKREKLLTEGELLTALMEFLQMD